MRILKVIKKEFKEFIRDKGFLLTMIVVPFILMLVSGYTFQSDITHLSTIVIDDDASTHSLEIIESIHESKYFNVIEFFGTLDQAKQLLKESKVRSVFYIPNDFGDKLQNATQAQIYFYVDSSDYTIYNILKGASGEVVKEALKDIIFLVVGELEEERDVKQKKIEDLDSLVDTLDGTTQNITIKVNEVKAQINTIKELIQNTESKIILTQNDVSRLDSETDSAKNNIISISSSLDNLKAALVQLKQSSPELAPSVDSIIAQIDAIKNDVKASIDELDKLRPSSKITISTSYYNIDSLKQNITSNEEKSNEVKNIADSMDVTYNDIKNKVDNLNLELRTLSRKFLSFPLDINRGYTVGEITYFEYITPAIITLVLFFIGVVLTTINIVDERTNKTLFRIATTPLKKYELFLGKFFIFFLAGIIETFYVISISIVIFNVQIAGKITDLMIVLFLLIAASLGLGLLVSAVVKTMRQAVMLIPLVVIPSILISQTFSPIEVMPKLMQQVAYLSPMFYSNVALREIMIKGTSLAGVMTQIIILGVYAFTALLLGILVSKKRVE